jgi:hypothetical protein
VRVAAAKAKVVLVAQEIARLLGTILAEYGVAQKKLVAMQKVLPQACADISAQLAALLAKGFVTAVPYERLAHFPRYLKAARMRLDKARAAAARDARLMADWQALGRPWERERLALAKSGQADPFLEEFAGWRNRLRCSPRNQDAFAGLGEAVAENVGGPAPCMKSPWRACGRYGNSAAATSSGRRCGRRWCRFSAGW